MRLLVCGGREYSDYARFIRLIEGIHVKHPLTTLIDGGARGADAMARAWAWSKEIQSSTYQANWDDVSHQEAHVKVRDDGKLYDAAAGGRRNEQMLNVGRPDMVLAFGGGPGTQDMMRRAVEAEVPTLWVPEGGVIIDGEPMNDDPIWLLKPDPAKPKIPRALPPTPSDRYDGEF